MTGRPRLLMAMGTRPEAVKTAPVALALIEAGLVEPLLLDVGQHPDRVAEGLAPFGLAPDLSWPLHRATGSLAELSTLTATAAQAELEATRPDAVFVQGDTMTALMTGLVAFWNRVPLVHLEAGLRTHDLRQPFPEEGNRALLARIAGLHLAPTVRAVANLAAEGLAGDHVVLTGNTVVDAVAQLLPSAAPIRVGTGPSLLVTVHRRESWGAGIARVCTAIERIAAAVPNARVTVVVHPNPQVSDQVHAALDPVDGVEVIDPLPYPQLLARLAGSDLVLTDSGGISEEAPSFGVPVMVARTVTERPELVEAGGALLVGTDPGAIAAHATRLLLDPAARALMQPRVNPFGDGFASRRCAAAIGWLLGTRGRPREWSPELEYSRQPS